ncbi:MAG: hypothetical protein MJ121_02575 [Clostridia bacterium]|nr:hypothetical protein [Clostridia bacterium]
MNKKRISVLLALLMALIFSVTASADLILGTPDEFTESEPESLTEVITDSVPVSEDETMVLFSADTETANDAEDETMILFSADDISADVTEEETAILFGAVDDETEIAFGDEYDDDADYSAKDSGFFSNIGGKILFSLIIGLVVAGIYVSILKGQLKSVKMNSGASDYMVKDSLKLSVKSDVYLYKNTSSTPKPKSNTKEN